MTEKDHQEYFEVLELTPDASPSEIRKAYLCLKELYSTDSIVTLPLIDEIPEEHRKEILNKIEEAYTILVNSYESEKNRSDGKSSFLDHDLQKIVSNKKTFNGKVLRRIRKKLKIDLHEITLATCIRKQYLEYIENENYDALPPELYVRSYVKNYAEYLSLDSLKVVSDYMNRYQEWKNTSKN